MHCFTVPCRSESLHRRRKEFQRFLRLCGVECRNSVSEGEKEGESVGETVGWNGLLCREKSAYGAAGRKGECLWVR